MNTMSQEEEITAFLDGLADGVSEWDAALVRQAVLAVGVGRGEFSANDLRDLLPAEAQRVAGLVIRQLPARRHGHLIARATTDSGHPKTVRSTAASTHGKALQVWTLTPAGLAAARRLLGGVGA